ncbi:ATP-dependent DNA helicase srs2 [Elsinoe australis]|uniref:DNA 3'-5' helicase n=1 Tax=Elsinoe australis TaxID=40998 RepID=A0A2P7ZQ45_9PEZI|nr:ATP-dependent DNA helicase srs2 [Elsinoe australis]
MTSVLEGLNPAQLAAVTSPANVLQVLAPPGSGKTKTLTARVAHLITSCGYKPWNILVCTFTVKAAKEMNLRLTGQIGEDAARKLVLGTFHSVARRYLVSYGHYIGLDKGFGIADAGDQKAIVKRVIKGGGWGMEPGKALGRISANKAKSKGLEGLRVEMAKGKAKGKEEEVEFLAVYEGYEEALRLSNLLDYDDLLLRCKELLRVRPEVVGNVQAVLIDEFQDTNEVQFELMGLFAQRWKTITIVGDPDQSIYGWRNAEVENLNKMRVLWPDTVAIFLEENYRSSAGILKAAQTVIEQDKQRPDKRLQATHGYGEIPVLRRLPTAEAEARWLVSEIKRTHGMSGGMLEHNDFAVLLRSVQLSRHIETALGNAGVPYRMVGGTKFYDRVEIKVLLDYLRVMERPEHNDALLRVLNVPARNVGEVSVKKLLDEATSKNVPVWKLLLGCVQGNARPATKLSAQAEKGLTDFVNVILSGRKKKDVSSPAELLDFLLKRLEYDQFLKRKYPEDHEARWANVEELKAQTRDLTTAIEDGTIGDEPLPDIDGTDQINTDTDNPLSVFLANIALSSTTEQKDASGLPPQCITISTIHAAKGLEWPVVFIPACYEGSIPHSRAEDHDEERRLLYVGMTRAQGMLYLSCPTKNSQQQETTLSNFLREDGVEKCFASAGPELEYVRIGKLATTLGRPCPEYDAVQASRMELDAGWDDIYWPTDGAMPLEEASKWDRGRGGTYAQPTSLRREGSDPRAAAYGSKQGFTTAARVTANAVEGCSVTTTMQALHGSFASARSRMQELEVLEEENRLKLVEQRKEEARKVKVGKKEAAAAKHGGDIKSFFGGGGMARQGSTASNGVVASLSRQASAGSVSSLSRQPSAGSVDGEVVVTARRPLDEIPAPKSENFSSHRVRSEPLMKRPKLAQHAENEPVTLGSVRPASTMHTTSVATLAGNNKGPVRKTLGLRREFVPWSARANK